MLYIVMDEIFTSHRFELLCELLYSLQCTAEFCHLKFHIRCGGSRGYNYVCHPEYKYKSIFAESTDPVEVYIILALSEQESISEELKKQITRHTLCFAELTMPD